MICNIIRTSLLLILTLFILALSKTDAQEIAVNINPEERFQTFTGFGASLAYYENWLTAHPNKNEIYETVFGELSLDILRVRNSHGYDAGMMNRVQEFFLLFLSIMHGGL